MRETIEYRRSNSYAYALVRVGRKVFWRRRGLKWGETEDYERGRFDTVDEFHDNFEKGLIERHDV